MSVDIKRLRELEQIADKTPWKHKGYQCVYDKDWQWIADCDNNANSRFIMEMRNALPELLDELEKLRKEREVRPLTLEEVREYCKDGNARPLWKEELEYPTIYGSYWAGRTKLVDFTTRTLVSDVYGTAWRCWHDRPTPEQSAAFPQEVAK